MGGPTAFVIAVYPDHIGKKRDIESPVFQGLYQVNPVLQFVEPVLLGLIVTPYATQNMTGGVQDRKSTRLNSSHVSISYAVFCLKKNKQRLWSTVDTS